MKRIWMQALGIESINTIQQVTIVGSVSPIEWDNKGCATKFSILTHDQENIIVENTTFNHKLNLLLNSVVEATGKLYENIEGEKCMWLKRIKEIRGPSSPAPATTSIHRDCYHEFSLNIPSEIA